MTKRITITVPDDLHGKMQKWKKHFNFSSIFQKATAEAIERKENFYQKFGQEGDDTMEEIIERLREEKLESEGDYYEMGKEEGEDWAKAAHYLDIKAVIEWIDTIRSYPFQTRRTYPDVEGINEYLDNLFEEHELMDCQAYLYDSDHEYNDKFFKGWRVGVEEFWDTVKDRL